ncbi:MAG TPA: hypothetical protein VH744_07490, partial [Terriglobales bacterium]
AALVEYFSDSFLRYWSRLAKELPQAENDRLVRKLSRRHARVVLCIFVIFAAICALSWIVFSRWFGTVPSARLLQTAVLGGLGYLLLSIALLENIILATMNATSSALKAVALGLAVNLVAGYALSHLLGVQYAAVGLLSGALVLVWSSSRAVARALRHPDYHYSIA